jgi:hypothetical protein
LEEPIQDVVGSGGARWHFSNCDISDRRRKTRRGVDRYLFLLCNDNRGEIITIDASSHNMEEYIFTLGIKNRSAMELGIIL